MHIAAPFRVNTAGPLFSPVLLSAAAPARAEEKAEASGEGTGAAAPPEQKPASGDATQTAAPGTRPGEPAAAAARPPASTLFEMRDLFRTPPLASTVMFSDPAALSKRDAAAAAGIVHWAWRASGTGTVIFRRWGGDDAAATEVIAHYYQALRAGKSPLGALHAARAAIRATESGHAPAAWAGWLVFGS